LGWSNGGITGLIIAANYPERIHKLIIWGATSYITLAEVEMTKREY